MWRASELTGIPLDEVSAGAGGAATVAALRGIRLRRTLLLLRYVCQRWPGDERRRDAAVRVLEEVRSHSAATVSELFGEPQLGAWVAWLSRRVRGTYDPGSQVELDLAYLVGAAAVAASRTGVSAELPGRAGHDGVYLPTLGRLRGVPAGPVTLWVEGSRIGISGSRADTTGAALVPLRSLAVGPPGRRLRVTVDDLDPYRGRYHVPPTGRLADEEIEPWRAALEQAWELLIEHCPDQADELAAGLRSLVPLRQGGPGMASSATAIDAFGAIGLTLPATAADLAVTLVHEFQHSKLAALLDLTRLYDAEHTQLYFAPWRTDPRPIDALFQGVYAFLAIAETWYRISADPAVGEAAVRNMAEIREQVAVGMSTLEDSGALTAAGVRFVAGLRERLSRLQAIQLPPDVAAQARATLYETHQAWQRRNPRRGED
jgi:HEXXH motif-containing protein